MSYFHHLEAIAVIQNNEKCKYHCLSCAKQLYEVKKKKKNTKTNFHAVSSFNVKYAEYF